MRKYILVLLAIGIFSSGSFAQESNDLDDLIKEVKKKKVQFDNRKIKEVGINLTQTITQFIPFNESLSQSGPFTLLFRSGRMSNRFNIQLGMRLKDEGRNNQTNDYFNLAVGFLKKKNISKKFNYFTSYNGILSFGSFNQPNEEFTDSGGFGVGFGFGLEYKISDHITLMTESMIVVSAFDDNISLNTIPPIGLFLIANFYKD